jgi:Icc protein
VLIVQLTDPHITRDGEQPRYLAEAIDWVNGLQPRPAAVLVSGDLANTGRPEQYAILRDVLAHCAAPVYVIPGNHDNRGPLREVLPPAQFPGVRGERLNYTVESRPARMIGLDTSQPRRPGGFLDRASLEWLEAALNAVPACPTLMFMHHPPFRTGVNAADLLGFHGLAAFRRIVAQHRSLLRIVSGHVHCERRAEIAQALATTSLSTAPQRVPELFERHIVGLRPEAPGFTAHTWQGGAFDSTTYINVGAGRFVERVSDYA